jgi:hypothetical protein
MAVRTKPPKFVGCWLVTNDTDKDDTNKATIWVPWGADANTMLPQPQQLIDNDLQELLHFIRVWLLGSRNDAKKHRIDSTIAAWNVNFRKSIPTVNLTEDVEGD